MSNHHYESVKETMITRGIDVPESYIERALRSYGFDKFPEGGLEDRGLDKLIKRATDIAHAEAQLIKRKPKREYLPIPKIKKESGLENSVASIIKEDLKKVGKTSLKIGKFAIYPTFGINFALPTMMRKAGEYTYPAMAALVSVLGLLEISMSYTLLFNINKKIIPWVIGTQITSGIYEYIRHVKRKQKKILRAAKRGVESIDCSP
jgi:hypothetical protein